MKDIVVSEKSDLFFYTEDDAQRKKRSRQYCGLCGDYPTCNDFLYYLKKI